MRSTASEPEWYENYRFSFSWQSPYGHALKLLDKVNPEPGLVLDLGCGYAAVAEPLTAQGFTYCGVDLDARALENVAGRGHQTHMLDLSDTGELPERLAENINDRTVAAVLALDVIEHLMVPPRAFLSALREALEPCGRPPLIVSVPNVTHADLGAKLTFGRWDYADTGLLDRTHVSFFTDSRLAEDTRATGFLQVAAEDFIGVESDQRFPSSHPALCKDAPVAQQLRIWRDTADPHGRTIQFVRAFLPSAPAPRRTDDALGVRPPEGARDLTVVMRTQGRRPQGLREALTCLAAQTVDTFDVRLMVHSDDEAAITAVRELVEEFHPTFASRVSVIRVPAGGGRSRPLNVGLEGLTSEYVAFLDDDDLVTADWAAAFCTQAGGCSVVRAQSAVRLLRAPANADEPYVAESGLEFRFSERFDLTEHLWKNQTPICAYAVPRSLIETFRLRFNEEFAVLEDWEFLLRCVVLAPVCDTGRVTSVVQISLEGDSSQSAHSAQLWKALERVHQERMNLQPLLLPPGSVASLVDLYERCAAAEGALSGLTEQAGHAGHVERELTRVVGAYDELARRYLEVVESKRWKVLGPAARAIEIYRRWQRKGKAKQAED
jgi:SAM-dependent methyltransferase